LRDGKLTSLAIAEANRLQALHEFANHVSDSGVCRAPPDADHPLAENRGVNGESLTSLVAKAGGGSEAQGRASIP
jgi:hypothetical protein